VAAAARWETERSARLTPSPPPLEHREQRRRAIAHDDVRGDRFGGRELALRKLIWLSIQADGESDSAEPPATADTFVRAGEVQAEMRLSEEKMTLGTSATPTLA
jgi:hypothetical protein